MRMRIALVLAAFAFGCASKPPAIHLPIEEPALRTVRPAPWGPPLEDLAGADTVRVFYLAPGPALYWRSRFDHLENYRVFTWQQVRGRASAMQLLEHVRRDSISAPRPLQPLFGIEFSSAGWRAVALLDSNQVQLRMDDLTWSAPAGSLDRDRWASLFSAR